MYSISNLCTVHDNTVYLFCSNALSQKYRYRLDVYFVDKTLDKYINFRKFLQLHYGIIIIIKIKIIKQNHYCTVRPSSLNHWLFVHYDRYSKYVYRMINGKPHGVILRNYRAIEYMYLRDDSEKWIVNRCQNLKKNAQFWLKWRFPQRWTAMFAASNLPQMPSTSASTLPRLCGPKISTVVYTTKYTCHTPTMVLQHAYH